MESLGAVTDTFWITFQFDGVNVTEVTAVVPWAGLSDEMLIVTSKAGSAVSTIA